ncbi:MAG: transposase [Rhodobacteraceae bacterium]|nr:transposase [Paracoccaceae bacterium]
MNSMTRAGSKSASTPSKTQLGLPPDRITAGTIHGVGRVYAALERRQIEAVIPPLRTTRRRGAKGFATGRFKFDPHHDVVRCPAKKRLKPRNSTKSGKWYRADRRDCARCPLKAQCLPQGVPSRRVHIVANHATILRARRNRTAWGDEEHAIYSRHRWRVEGTHGTAKTLHGLNRAIRRGLENTKIQALLTAIAMNLKKSAIATFLIHRTPAGRCARWTPLQLHDRGYSTAPPDRLSLREPGFTHPHAPSPCSPRGERRDAPPCGPP